MKRPTAGELVVELLDNMKFDAAKYEKRIALLETQIEHHGFGKTWDQGYRRGEITSTGIILAELKEQIENYQPFVCTECNEFMQLSEDVSKYTPATIQDALMPSCCEECAEKARQDEAGNRAYDLEVERALAS